jgi:formate-nitrite transporter family protein
VGDEISDELVPGRELKQQKAVADAEVSAIEEETEEQSVEAATRLSSRLIYEVIRRDGEDELARPKASLIWSGVAAGMLISFSVIGEATFRSNMTEGGTRFLVENLGYSLGFLLVITGRMQLFTENTITTVLPLVARPSRSTLYGTARLWSIVLSANLVGAFVAATFIAYSGGLPPVTVAAVAELSRHATDMTPWEAVVRAMPAGVLIAALVWMMPSVAGNSFWWIIVLTWLIAAGDFAHVVAGSVEMAFLVVTGEISILRGLGGFFLPVLLGNVIGGTMIFTMLAWGQVRHELGRKGRSWRRFARLRSM